MLKVTIEILSNLTVYTININCLLQPMEKHFNYKSYLGSNVYNLNQILDALNVFTIFKFI